ncbi:TetR family transcriptional regulator [Humitalea rosea]|uniref:TetR family transcriptional regulator n=1 Tax=Humitalea rosea TaxID=990373 RepID=A0A2W7IMM6_9PROT|nr:TetR/AcrR family transcriptional regulator [Humitalea rosea]PZW48085.1 TetR family transcriptional regulator [Humitalea rosea]
MRIKDTAPAAAPRRGRPRSPEVRERILAATEELLSEGGFQAVTVEAVAARAGVAKTSLYRWWPNRAAVALDCVSARMTPIADEAGMGGFRERFRRQLKATIRLLNSPQGQAILALIGAKQTDPALAQSYSEQIARPRRAQTRMLLQQATRAGEIAAGTDPDVFLDAIYGPLYYRKVVSGEPVTDEFIDRIVDAAFIAFGAKPGAE